MDRGLTQSEKRWRQWNKVAVGASVGVIAALGAATKKSIDAAKEAETSASRMRTQLAALGVNYGKHAEIIEKVTQRQSKLFAIDDEDLQDAFTHLVRATGDVDSALKSTALAADVARGKQISLEAATMVVTKAHMGQAGALRRMGIDVDKTATKQQLLAALQTKFAGQAVAHGKSAEAASERHRVATENLQEQYGQGLLPIYTQAIGKLGDLLGLMSRHQGATQTTIVAVAGLATGVLAVNAAVKVYAAGTAALTAVTAASTPVLMAYRGALWKTAAAGRDVTAATKAATAAQVLLRGALLVNPIVAAALAVGGLAVGLHHLKGRQAEAREESRKAASGLLEQARAAGTLFDAQLALRGAQLDAKEANLAESAAAKEVARHRTAGTLATLEGQQAIAAYERAQLNSSLADKAAGEAADAAAKKRKTAVDAAREAVAKLNAIERKRQELARLEREWKNEDNSSAVRASFGGQATKADKELQVLLAGEKQLQKQREELRLSNYGAIDKIDGQWVLRQGKRWARAQQQRRNWITRGNLWSEAELARFPHMVKPHVDRANRTIAKTGDVTIPRAKVDRNLVAPFKGAGPRISKQIGTISVSMLASIKGFVGDDDVMGYGQVPKGVDPDVGRAAALGRTLGLTAKSWLRPGAITASGNVSDHATGHAVDMAGPPGRMAAFYKALGNFPGLKQRIYSPLDGWSDDHYDHVHVAMFQQGGRVGRRGSGCHCSSCVERGAVMRANHGGRVPSMPWSGASGDSVPALLEPDEVVVNRSFTRAYPGGPGAFDRDTNGSVPRFARGGVAGALAGARARADDSLRSQLRRMVAKKKELASVVAQLRKKPKDAALKTKRNELADEVIGLEQSVKDQRKANRQLLADQRTATAEAAAAALRSSVTDALAGRGYDDDIAGLRARGTAGLDDDVAALDRRRGTNVDRIALTQAAIGRAVDDETRRDLQGQLNDAIREQIELDQERSSLIEQQNEQRQQEIASTVSRTHALSDAERDLLAAKAEATATTDDDKLVLQAEIDAWVAKLGELQALQQRGDLTEQTRIDLLGQEAAAIRGLTDAQKRQEQLTTEVENQIQARLRSEQDAILGARSRFQSEFASNTFARGGSPAYVNGPATPTEVHVHQNFTTQPQDPWVWIKSSQGAAESVFGG